MNQGVNACAFPTLLIAFSKKTLHSEWPVRVEEGGVLWDC